MPAVGFGMGIERLLLSLESRGISLPVEDHLDVFIASVGEEAELKSFSLISELRNNNISADKDNMKRSLKGQMKYANKLDARYTAILGDDEIKSGMLTLKNMENGEQSEIKMDELSDTLKKIL